MYIQKISYILNFAETEQDQFCVDIPDAEAECIPETITKNIIINYQECDGEEQANNCFTEPVPDCKVSIFSLWSEICILSMKN